MSKSIGAVVFGCVIGVGGSAVLGGDFDMLAKSQQAGTDLGKRRSGV